MSSKWMDGLNPNRRSIVAVISTHGVIPTNNGEVTSELFEIPEDVEVYKITVSAPGTVAINGSRDVDTHIQYIQYHLTELFKKDLSLDSFVDHLKEYSKQHRQHAASQLKSETNKNSSHYYKSLDFLCHHRKGYNVFQLNRFEPIVNKLFVRNLSEKNGNMFSIIEMNKTSNPLFRSRPDLMSKILENSGLPLDNGDVKQILSLKNVIDYYVTLHFKRIILFDFSCSIYINGDTFGELSREEVKRIRTNMCETSIAYGGKTKRKRNRTHKKTILKQKNRTIIPWTPKLSRKFKRRKENAKKNALKSAI